MIGLFALDEGAWGKKLSLKNVSIMCSSSDNQTQLDCCGDEVSSGDVKWIRYVAVELSNRYASCRDKCSILYVSGSLGTGRIYVRQKEYVTRDGHGAGLHLQWDCWDRWARTPLERNASPVQRRQERIPASTIDAHRVCKACERTSVDSCRQDSEVW